MRRCGRGVLAVAGCLAVATGCVVRRPDPESSTPVPVAGSMPDVTAVVGGVYRLGQALDEERARTATLQRQLDERTQEVQTLRAEVGQLRGGATADEAPAAAASTGAAPAAAAPAAAAGIDGTGTPPGSPTPVPQALAALRSELAHETQRRVVAEDELARLKRETSTSPFEKAAGPEKQLEALVVAKQQVAALQTALAEERRTRERLTDELRALQARSAGATAADAEDAAMRHQIETLQREKDLLVDAFNRSLAESQRRSAELEQVLAVARSASGSDDAGTAGAGLRIENETLRQRLDEERRRTDELAAKLRAATRVADLIFKMQAQEEAAPRAPAPPR